MESTNKQHKIGWITLSVILVIASIAAYFIFSKQQNQYNDLTGEYTAMNEVLNQRDAVVNELVSAFDEIERNLDSIKMKRTQLALLGSEGNTTQKERIVEGIRLLDALLDQSNQKIAQLESKLKKSGIDVSSFNKKIAELSKNVETQNEQIAVLKQEIENREYTILAMNEKMVGMAQDISIKKDSIELQQKTIRDIDKQMNTAYLAYGTSKELMQKGLLVKEGGILNIGGTKSISKTFDQEYFVQLDKREVKQIPIYSRKARIISEHPDSSYHFIEEGGLITALAIEDPNEFWKISRYALIEIK